MVIDTLFLLASAAFGFGLSLATYRLFAGRNGWPMGEVQSNAPALAVLIGLLGVIAGFGFAASRGTEYGGWGILLVGLVLALFWTGFLRVASQISLFLAPVATVMLVLGWLHVQLPGSDREIVPSKTYYDSRGRLQEFRDERGRIDQLPGPIDGTPRVIDPSRIDERAPVRRTP